MEEQPVEPGALAVGVRFRPSGRIYDFDPGPLLLARDDRVLVETERGPALGTVVVPARLRPAARALQRVIKKADSRDLAREDQNLQRERQHYRTALELVRGRNLAIKLIKAESAFDASKVTFFFGGEERADLRDLGRELGELLRTRVEMKQIGARDET
ncbi:MAG TPA: PSP1 domain-containing protein, partial [Candidatus Elarobacter sp.]|nr:PSP1 domain-containing protein [Candidatus Elarobacter sp.]